MKTPIVRRFAILSFLCVLAMALAMGGALSALLTRAVSAWEWDNTVAFTLRQVERVGPDALFRSLRDPNARGRSGEALSRLMTDLPEVVRVKVWDRQATILWSDEPRLIGQRFPDSEDLRESLEGKVAVEFKQLTKAEHGYERERFGTLAEVYVPIFSKESGQILGVIEVYKTADRLVATIRWGRVIIWAISLSGALALYVVLLPLVRQVYGREVEENALRGYAGRLELEVANRTRELQMRTEHALYRAEKLAALSALTRTMTSPRESRQVFQAVAEAAASLLGARIAHVWMDDPAEGALRPEGSFHADPRFEALMADLPFIPYGGGVTGRVFESGAPEYILDAQSDPRWLNRRLLEEGDIHAYAGLPLIAGKRAVGVLSIFFGLRGAFTLEEKELMSLLADHAAIAILNTQLFAQAEASRARAETSGRRFENLARLAQAVTSTLELREVLASVAQAATDLLPDSSARIWVAEGERLVLRSEAGVAGAPRSGRKTELAFGEGLTGRVALTREPLVVENVLEDPRSVNVEWMRQEGYVSLVGLPLLVGERFAGVLSLLTRHLHRFSQEELEILTSFGTQAAIAIENARLYGELRQALADVEASQQRIIEIERLRALGEMAGGVAHDFNNTLAVILGRARLLLAQTQDPELQRQLRVVEKAALDGAQTVRRIQEFTRMRRGRPFASVDLNRVVEEVVEITRSRWKDEAQAKGVPYDVRIEASPLPPVLGDASELREALTNILFNALDAMPEGGRVTFKTAIAGDSVTCSVSDTGGGMTEEVRQRVFDPFFTTKGERGSGLGLSVVYGIITRHGGEIEVQSQVGRGSTFTVRLPVPREVPEASETTQSPKPRRRARILVIDDEEEIRDVLGELLESQGHIVATSSGGEPGLARLEQEPFDLLITDLAMPGLTGWQVANLAKLKHPALPVAMVTGWGDRIDSEEARGKGVDYVVSKPFKPEDLQAIIAGALARSAAPAR